MYTRVVALTPDYREALVTGLRPLPVNPLIDSSDPAVHDVGQLLYRRLVKLNQQAYPVPDLAAHFSISSDGLTYEFDLPSGIKWSDGHALQAQDVAATVKFVQQTGYPDTAIASNWRHVTVSASDGEKVTFHLSTPHAAFFTDLTEFPILPLAGASDATLKAMLQTPAKAMATSGDYVVDSNNTQHIVLALNPQSPNHPSLKILQFDLYSNFSDAVSNPAPEDCILATNADQAARAAKNGRRSYPLISNQFADLLFNEQMPALADITVRQAINLAVDRTALVQAASGLALPESGPIPPGIPWAAQASGDATADSLAANQLLDSAGWVNGLDGVRSQNGLPLDFTMLVSNADPFPAIAKALAAQLKTIGISVRTMPFSSEQILSNVNSGDFQLAIADWNMSSDPDVSPFWRSDALPPKGFNVSGGQPDAFLDQGLDALATLNGIHQRQVAAAQVTAQLAADLPAIFLISPELSMVCGATVTGLEPQLAAARFDDFSSWRRQGS